MEGDLFTHSQGAKGWTNNQRSPGSYRRLRNYPTGYSGKRGRAVIVDASMAAPIEYGEEKGVSIPTTPETAVQTIEPEMQVFDLYAVGHDLEHTIQPFIHRLNICSKGGEVIRVWANFDDGALANAMSITKFNAVKHRL